MFYMASYVQKNIRTFHSTSVMDNTKAPWLLSSLLMTGGYWRSISNLSTMNVDYSVVSSSHRGIAGPNIPRKNILPFFATAWMSACIHADRNVSWIFNGRQIGWIDWPSQKRFSFARSPDTRGLALSCWNTPPQWVSNDKMWRWIMVYRYLTTLSVLGGYNEPCPPIT